MSLKFLQSLWRSLFRKGDHDAVNEPVGRIYVSGPMRGYPLYNFPAFDAAADELRKAGWKVINPAEMDRKHGFNPETDEPSEEFLRQAYRRDAMSLALCDAIYMLRGWENSVGANWELYDLAEKFGLEVHFQP